eukprot:m.60076 g.60076  ORF g.60076 m.60076 type:complete len:147 (+) comp11350_c0_seq1:46-486(+)
MVAGKGKASSSANGVEKISGSVSTKGKKSNKHGDGKSKTDKIDELRIAVVKKEAAERKMIEAEETVYNMEQDLLISTREWGNVFRGFGGYLNNKPPTTTQGDRKSRKIYDEDRYLSGSSITTPIQNADTLFGAFKKGKRRKKKGKH